MASIRQDKRTGRYLILFRYSGRQFQRGLKTTSRKDADAARARVDETIRLLERGRLEIPEGADPATFILSDGTQTKKPAARKQLTIGELLQTYDGSRLERVKEDTTVTTERIHLKHLRKYLPLRNAAQSVAVADLQRYVSRRLKDKWRGQLIEVTDKVAGENQTQRVSYITKTLKQLARELQCPVLLLSQLSRECEKRVDKRPIPSDLRDSGSIEQDADKILMLYRESEYNEDCDNPNLTEVLIRKNRHGPKGCVELHFAHEKMSFADCNDTAKAEIGTGKQPVRSS